MIEHETLINFYNLYSKEIFNYCYHLTGVYEAAEDVLQDCFINLIEYSKKNVINSETVKSFLYKTAHNLAINYIKKNEKISYLDDDNNYSTVDTIAETIANEEMNTEILVAIQNLDVKARSIFLLKRENNYTNEEIAKILNISERTVRRKLQQALSHILVHLKNKGFYNNL